MHVDLGLIGLKVPRLTLIVLKPGFDTRFARRLLHIIRRTHILIYHFYICVRTRSWPIVREPEEPTAIIAAAAARHTIVASSLFISHMYFYYWLYIVHCCYLFIARESDSYNLSHRETRRLINYIYWRTWKRVRPSLCNPHPQNYARFPQRRGTPRITRIIKYFIIKTCCCSVITITASTSSLIPDVYLIHVLFSFENSIVTKRVSFTDILFKDAIIDEALYPYHCIIIISSMR